MAGSFSEHTSEVRDALLAIAADPAHGPAAFSQPQLMARLLEDYLPDAPRERSMLVAAAAARLADQLREQTARGTDARTAVSITAASFAATSAFTPQACEWAAEELAVASGLVQAGALGASQPSGPGVLAPGAGPGSPDPRQRAGERTSAGSGYLAGGSGEPATRPADSLTEPANPGPGGYPPAGGWHPAAAGPGAVRSRRGLLFTAAAVAAAVVVVLALLALRSRDHTDTAAGGRTPGPSSAPPPSSPSSPATSPGTGVEPLSQLAKSAGTQCTSKNLGYAINVKCDDKTLPGGYFIAYQYPNAASYEAGVTSDEQVLHLDPSHLGPACPPAHGFHAGQTPWTRAPRFTHPAGQYLKCLYSTTYNGPVLVWTMPSERVLWIAPSLGGVSQPALYRWWQSLNWPAQ